MQVASITTPSSTIKKAVRVVMFVPPCEGLPWVSNYAEMADPSPLSSRHSIVWSLEYGVVVVVLGTPAMTDTPRRYTSIWSR